ncbi:hypothetical protein F4804DRAFT_265286 [Jackrogersella minutella]|nr:hypothetical protein F4804DRAFT_265286 [Jackrogersella minutella]
MVWREGKKRKLWALKVQSTWGWLGQSKLFFFLLLSLFYFLSFLFGRVPDPDRTNTGPILQGSRFESQSQGLVFPSPPSSAPLSVTLRGWL